MEAQPYRKGARMPGAALDAMRAGVASPAPGAAILAASTGAQERNSANKAPHPLLGRKRRKIMVPRP